MPRPRHPPYQGGLVNTSALTKSAAAAALAAVALLGVAACTSADPHAAKTHSGTSSARPTPTSSAAPQAGVESKVQCLAVEGKLAGSAAELQSAMASLSGGDPSSALGPLQSVQKDLDGEIGSVTDPALQASAAKLKTDFDQLVTTVNAAAVAYSARNVSEAQAQSAKLEPEKAALEADAAGLQKICD